MHEAPSLSIAFLAGLLSFLSPCVLPLVPSYLAAIGGASRPLLPALGFVAGFGLVFVMLGATASALGALLAPHKLIIGQLSGLLIVFFGLMMLGVIRPAWYARDTRNFQNGQAGPMALGAAFAFGWSPCLGPVLGSILGLAASSSSLSRGVLLLFCYTLGLALPFLLSAVAWEKLNLRGLNRYAPIFEKVGGALLVALGVLMASGQFAKLAGYVYDIMPSWMAL